MENKINKDFIQIFRLSEDNTKPGRVLYSAKIGEVYMTRIMIDPGVIIGNHYRKNTRVMYHLCSGQALVVFEDVATKQKQEFMLRQKREVVHVPENVALAVKNVGNDVAELVAFSNNPLRSEDTVEYKVM